MIWLSNCLERARPRMWWRTIANDPVYEDDLTGRWKITEGGSVLFEARVISRYEGHKKMDCQFPYWTKCVVRTFWLAAENILPRSSRKKKEVIYDCRKSSS